MLRAWHQLELLLQALAGQPAAKTRLLGRDGVKPVSALIHRTDQDKTAHWYLMGLSRIRHRLKGSLPISERGDQGGISRSRAVTTVTLSAPPTFFACWIRR